MKKFKKGKTKNSIEFFVLEMPEALTVSVGVIVHAGTRDEIYPREKGIAHALEHMCFQGTKYFDNQKELRAYIEDVGGDLNANTSTDRTVYWSRAPKDHNERIFHILSEQVLNPLIPEEKIENEMNNIKEEIKRFEDNHLSVVLDKGLNVMYGDETVGRSILGDAGSIENLKRKDFVDFHNRNYKNNFRIVVVGNIEFNQAKNYIEKYFKNGDFKLNKKRPKSKLKPVKKSVTKIYRDLKQSHVLISFHIPNKYKELYPLILYSQMIDGGASSPLFQKIREENGLAYACGAYIRQSVDTAIFYIGISLDSKNTEKAMKLIREVVDDNKKNIELMNKTKVAWLGSMSSYYENTGSIFHTTINDISNIGRPLDFEEEKKMIESIKIEDITRLVDKYLSPDKQFVTIVGPNKEKK